MGQLAEALKAGPPTAAKICGVQRWLDSLTDDDRAEFAACSELARGHLDGWTISRLYDVCAPNGLALNYDALNKHCVGRCGCDARA